MARPFDLKGRKGWCYFTSGWWGAVPGKLHFNEFKVQNRIGCFTALINDSNIGGDCSFLHSNTFHHRNLLATNMLEDAILLISETGTKLNYLALLVL